MRKPLKAHIKHAVTTPEYTKILILRTLGNFLIFSSLFMIAKTFYLPVREEVRFLIDSQLKTRYVIADKKEQGPPPKGGLAKILTANRVEVLAPVDPQFSILIPKIGANAQILPNINPVSEEEYLGALQKGVAHAAGTAFPGESGHVFLFAHSTDYFWNVGTYNAVFYLLSKLETGDEINLYYKGTRYVYRTIGKEVVNPEDVQYLTRKTNKEFLTLQTCWPPGTTLKRLMIFATRVSE